MSDDSWTKERRPVAVERAEGCPFDGERVASLRFARSDACSAVYNVSPILPGHSLVIPDRHAESVLDLSESELAALTKLARLITPLVMEVMGMKAFDWTLQDGEPAGQTVPHVHLHVIPRVDGDLERPSAWYPRLELERQRQERGARRSSDHRRDADAASLRVIVERLRAEARRRGLWPVCSAERHGS